MKSPVCVRVPPTNKLEQCSQKRQQLLGNSSINMFLWQRIHMQQQATAEELLDVVKRK
jgi:hypothetical protein